MRWFLALFGDQVVPFEYAGMRSGRVTRGLRFQEQSEFSVADTAAYYSVLSAQGIILDTEERKATIAAQVKKLMAEVNASEELDAGLLDEVNMLVEAPTALRGTFEEKHLELPAEALISVMKKHQRYFPVKDVDGKLMPYFVTVRNGGDQFLETVADGNEQVVRGRVLRMPLSSFQKTCSRTSPLKTYCPAWTRSSSNTSWDRCSIRANALKL